MPKSLLLLTTLSLLLSACQQATPVASSPAPYPVTGPAASWGQSLYEVQVQGSGNGPLSITAGPLRSGLSAQDLIDAPEPLEISAPLSVSTFTNTTTRTRHIRATFKVTNNTQQTLQNLMFLPVDTSDTDSDLSNNLTPPTTGTTPFRNVRFYDGSDASSKADQLQATRGKVFNSSIGTTDDDPLASPFQTGVSVSAVKLTVPAGLTASIKDEGWQVSPTLAPGQSANVTFGFDIPNIDPNNPGADPYSFSLVFAGGMDRPPPALVSAVKQYDSASKTFGNYTRFPVAQGGHSLPAYYDLRYVKGDAVLCSDAGVSVQNISSAAFPNRFRVEVSTLGNHALNAYTGTSCPPEGSASPLVTQAVSGVGMAKVPLAGGALHTLAVKADGTLMAWGRNYSGQLGDGTTTDQTTPVNVTTLTDVLSVAAGDEHSLALKADGMVTAWGLNSFGRLGDGTTTNKTTPVNVMGLADVVSVSAGSQYSLALKIDGTVMAWGNNFYGQLGDGTTTNRTSPVSVSGLTDVVNVMTGDYHVVALKADGTVKAWGRNNAGQLGDGTTTNRTSPISVSGLTDVVNVAAGSFHSLALKTDGTVMTWGLNGSGQLGDGTATSSRMPVSVSSLTNVVNVTTSHSSSHNLALKADGTVMAWGYNFYGQLGDGTTTNRFSPVTTTVPAPVVAIAAGSSHSLALKADGTVKAWGMNIVGQLGDGTTTDRPLPVSVVGLTDVAQPIP